MMFCMGPGFEFFFFFLSKAVVLAKKEEAYAKWVGAWAQPFFFCRCKNAFSVQVGIRWVTKMTLKAMTKP